MMNDYITFRVKENKKTFWVSLFEDGWLQYDNNKQYHFSAIVIDKADRTMTVHMSDGIIWQYKHGRIKQVGSELSKIKKYTMKTSSISMPSLIKWVENQQALQQVNYQPLN